MGWRTINWLKHSRRNDVQCNAASTNSALLAQELAANKALAREARFSFTVGYSMNLSTPGGLVP